MTRHIDPILRWTRGKGMRRFVYLLSPTPFGLYSGLERGGGGGDYCSPMDWNTNLHAYSQVLLMRCFSFGGRLGFSAFWWWCNVQGMCVNQKSWAMFIYGSSFTCSCSIIHVDCIIWSSYKFCWVPCFRCLQIMGDFVYLFLLFSKMIGRCPNCNIIRTIHIV